MLTKDKIKSVLLSINENTSVDFIAKDREITLRKLDDDQFYNDKIGYVNLELAVAMMDIIKPEIWI